MAGPGMKVAPLFMIGGGAIFLWSGLSGKSWSQVLKNLIQGKTPTTAPVTQSIQGTPLSAFGYGVTGGPAPGKLASVSGTGNISGPVLSPGAISGLWVMAGGNPAKASVATCIAMHESGGRVAVTSSNPDGGTNVGLWQLDTPGGKGAGYSITQLQNPLTNARVAIKGSSNGTNWSAWATAGSCGV